MLEKLFRLSENGTNVRTEVIAGATTFLSMSYIIFFQPALLSLAGMDFGSVMMATCLSSAIACLFMAFLANYPIAQAPGMGENFYFVFTVVLGMGIAWETALGAVFMSGVIFLLLTVFHIREMIIEAIPASLKSAIPAAIGIFITFIGLVYAGIVVKAPGDAIITIGDLHARPTLLSIIGLIIMLFLMVRKVKGAMLIGMIATALIGIIMGVVEFHGVVSAPPSIAPTFLKLDIRGALNLGLFSVLLIFLLMDMCDTVGTLIGVGEATGLMKDGTLPRAQQALFSDAIGTISGALFGTSTVTSYIESTTGVREGGRTGLTAVVVAVFMLLAVFFSPLVKMIGGEYAVMGADGEILYKLYPVVAPALILVGSYMAKSMTRCKWDDITEAVPAFMTIVGMALTYSIAHGLAFGFILYPAIKLMAGRGKDVSWMMYVLGGLFLVKYIVLPG